MNDNVEFYVLSDTLFRVYTNQSDVKITIWNSINKSWEPYGISYDLLKVKGKKY